MGPAETPLLPPSVQVAARSPSPCGQLCPAPLRSREPTCALGPDWWQMGTGRATRTVLPSSAPTKQSTRRRPGDRGLWDVDPGHRGRRERLAEEQRAETKAGSHSGQHPASSPAGQGSGKHSSEVRKEAKEPRRLGRHGREQA